MNRRVQQHRQTQQWTDRWTDDLPQHECALQTTMQKKMH